tara:strand:- start:4118 stop:5149 length:1032 start_codon:yes stop_codon:yes gene_type:complete
MDADDADSEELEHELTLDEHGRTAVDAGTCNYRTRAWDEAIPRASVPALVADCEAAYVKVTTQTRLRGLKYSTNATYWVPANATPHSTLERLALRLFEHHTRGVEFDPTRSGAEWWSQVVSAHDAGFGTIGFHWDRDYELHYDQGVCVHPHVATVTYLSDTGAPTVVLPVASPAEADAVAESCCGPLRGAHACWPRVGRHLAFDGRMLHGAPTDLAAGPPPGDGTKRVTLLVNCWLNHVPWGADPVHEEVAAQMSASLPALDLSRPCAPSRRVSDCNGGTLRWEVSHVGDESMTLALPAKAAWAAEPGALLSLAFRSRGGAALERTTATSAERGAATRKKRRR